MNRKLTDIMSEIQEELLELPQDKLISQVSLSRIKALALEGIKEEEQNINKAKNRGQDNQKENEQKGNINLEAYRTNLEAIDKSEENKVLSFTKAHGKKIIKKRIMLLIATMILAVGTIAAVHYNPTLNSIFGELFPFKDQVQSISKSMSVNGLTFTAEGALIDNKSGIFIASFTKDDGSTFEEGTQVKQIQLITEKLGSKGWTTQYQLSEDRKQLNCIVDLSGNRQLSGQKLTLEATDIRIWRQLRAKSEMGLEKLEAQEIHQPWKNNKSAEGLQLNLVRDFKEISIDAFNVSDKGIEIITSYYDQENIEDQYIAIQIIDNRTQKVYEPSESEHYWSNEEALNKDYYVFNQFTKEDLPYLEINVMNSYYEDLLHGNWQVDFELNKNKQVKSKRIYQTVKTGGQHLIITKVDVSALGVNLEGYKFSKKMEVFQEVYLKMKDGTRIKLSNTGSNSGGIKFNMYYNAIKTEGDNDLIFYDFINIEEVESVVIGENEIFLQ